MMETQDEIIFEDVSMANETRTNSVWWRSALACCALFAVAGTAAASDPLPDWPAQKCAMKRIKLIAKGIKQHTDCLARAVNKAEEIDPDCLARADAKLDRLWAKNDDKSQCTSEVAGLVLNVHDLIGDLRDTLNNNAVLGLDPEPLDDENPSRLAFLAPFCRFGPGDFDDEEAYREARIANHCFPNFHQHLYTAAVPLEELLIPNSIMGEYCAELAIAQELTPTTASFDVWMSTANTEPATRFERAAGNYILPSGTVVANGWDDLVDGTLDHAINEDVTGQVTPWAPMASGTQADGTAGAHCDSLTDFTDASRGTLGQTAPDSSWSAWFQSSCANFELWPQQGVSFYCFQQTGPAPNIGN